MAVCASNSQHRNIFFWGSITVTCLWKEGSTDNDGDWSRFSACERSARDGGMSYRCAFVFQKTRKVDLSATVLFRSYDQYNNAVWWKVCYSVKMSSKNIARRESTLRVGDLFATFYQVEQALQEYQDKNFIKLQKRHAGSIINARRRAPNRKFNAHLKYDELHYHCVHGVTVEYMSNSGGPRPNTM